MDNNSMLTIDFNLPENEIADKYLALPESVRLALIQILLTDKKYLEFRNLEIAVYYHGKEKVSETERFAFSAWCGAIAWVNDLLGYDL